MRFGDRSNTDDDRRLVRASRRVLFGYILALACATLWLLRDSPPSYDGANGQAWSEYTKHNAAFALFSWLGSGALVLGAWMNCLRRPRPRSVLWHWVLLAPLATAAAWIVFVPHVLFST